MEEQLPPDQSIKEQLTSLSQRVARLEHIERRRKILRIIIGVLFVLYLLISLFFVNSIINNFSTF